MSAFPLTATQRATWLDRLPAFELGGVNPSWYLEVDLTDLDVARLTEAWRRLVVRHPALRTVVTDDGQQHVMPDPPPYDIPVGDADLLDIVFDPRRWPLFALRVSRLDDRRSRLHVVIDQFVADRESLRILGQDLFGFYLGEPPTTQPCSFADAVPFLTTAASPGRAEDLPPAPQPPLSVDPQTIRRPRYTRRRGTLPAAQWQQLRQHAAGLALDAVLQAAFGEALAGWCKEPRFTILCRREQRPPIPGADLAVGDFSTLALTGIDADPRLPFRQRAAAVQHHADGVDALDELRRASGQPTAAAIPVLHRIRLHAEPAPDTPGWILALAQTPRTWLYHDACDATGALELTYDTVDELFPPGLLDDLCAHHLYLLRRLADDPTAWEEPAGECLPAAQYAVRRAVNDTGAALKEVLLHEPFWAQSRRTPDAPAVVATDRTLTYRELRTAAGTLADRLIERGARPNHMVAIVMEKGWQQPVAVYGVLDAGAAYVPVEPDLPSERFHYLLQHAQVSTALVQPHLLDTLPWPPGVEPIPVDDTVFDGPDQPYPRRIQTPRDLAYIIYTSGSTGLPKGVMIEHRSALNTVLDINRRFGVTAADRMLALTPLSFDLSVYDLFGPFAVGGALVMPDAGTGRAPWHWAELLEQHDVTLWNTVPALMEMLVGYLQGRRERLPEKLRLVLMSGDWIPISLPARIRALAADGIDLISLGGATEAAIWSIWHRITDLQPGWVSIPYGKPLANQHFEILDEALRRRPDWVPGEQYVGGYGVARGYWRDEDKTRRAFITHPHTGQRLYRTGDLGRYFPDGSIEFLGREDFQIKIHGYRIELGEIEAALTSHETVETAVVTAIGKARGEKRLVAYVTRAAGVDAADPDVLVKSIRDHLGGKLPSYMVPSHILVLDAFPLTRNGKIDRSALPAPVAPRTRSQAAAEPPEAATRIAAVWQAILDTEVGVDDDYFALGATPAQVIDAQYRLRDLGVTLDSLFAHRTARAVADGLA